MLKGLYSRRLKASNLQSKFKEHAKIEGELEWHEIEYLETCISHLLYITLGWDNCIDVKQNQYYGEMILA